MKKYLNLFAILIIAMAVFASCGDDEKPTLDPPRPVPVDPGSLPRTSAVNIIFSNVANPLAGQFCQAYQDINYRFYFGVDSTALKVPKDTNSNYPATFISTQPDAGIKSSYTQSGQFLQVDYWIGKNKDQHFSFLSGNLFIDSTATDTIKTGTYAGIHHYISGKFSFSMRDNFNGEIKDSISGTFRDVPLTK